MENLNEQEQIKNPNQLDLFEGILLSPEQEKQSVEFVERRKRQVEDRKKVMEQIESQLLAAGFIKDIHFVNDFKAEIVTKEVELGYRYNKTQFKVELTYLDDTGSISLKGTHYPLIIKKNRRKKILF
jgi:ribosomal protein S8